MVGGFGSVGGSVFLFVFGILISLVLVLFGLCFVLFGCRSFPGARPMTSSLRSWLSWLVLFAFPWLALGFVAGVIVGTVRVVS